MYRYGLVLGCEQKNEKITFMALISSREKGGKMVHQRGSFQYLQSLPSPLGFITHHIILITGESSRIKQMWKPLVKKRVRTCDAFEIVIIIIVAIIRVYGLVYTVVVIILKEAGSTWMLFLS